MYTIERHVDRLVEIRIWSPVSFEEATQWGADHDRIVAEVNGPYVCFVDVVGATVFPPDVADAYVATMKREPLLLRTGVLLDPSPTLSLQVQRMIREGDNPDRRAFHDACDLEMWLGGVLSRAEMARLVAVLTERGRYTRGALPPAESSAVRQVGRSWSNRDLTAANARGAA